MTLSKEIIDRFMGIDPATIGHHVNGGFMRPEMKPINRTSKMVGPAYTVRLVGKDSAALYYALKHAPEGSVIVVDRCGDQNFACVGEIVALMAEVRGLAGIVIDGAATDSLAIEKSGFPVFCTGISAVTTMVYGVTSEYDIPVSCCGAIVNPGDIIFGDADGVIVLPPTDFEEALTKSEAAIKREVEIKEYVRTHKGPHINIDKLMQTDLIGYINELKKF